MYDGDLISPEKAWEHYSTVLHLSSAGIISVTVEECHIQALQVLSAPEHFPEHVLIDFTVIASNRIVSVTKFLKYAAETRGWLFLAENCF